MIHVLTVHWQSDSWVDLQLAYLARHVRAPFRVYAWLNDLPEGHAGKYFYSTTEPVESHAVKLNRLAEIAAGHGAAPDDWLMFLDGDAFPVGDVVAFGEDKLARHPLAAVQRRENNGDLQPHPCFCLTTVGFWQAIGGDWREGHRWPNRQGEPVTDVGGNLLGILERRGIAWYPMLRSNKRDLHPLFFGLYEDLVYHHGAAFRAPLSRLDWKHAHEQAPFAQARLRLCRRLARRPAGRVTAWLTWLLDPKTAVLRRNRALMRRVRKAIDADPLFYRYFQQGG